ncbi:acyl carrier protein [Streptomyces albulus]|nr:acyl carrier protein [Streptomyces noursei]
MIRGWLVEVFAEELRMKKEELDGGLAFHELGVDSILLAQVLQPINRRISDPIDPSALYEYATFDEFAQWLADTRGDELALVLGAAPAALEPAVPAAPAAAPARRPAARRPAAPAGPRPGPRPGSTPPGRSAPTSRWSAWRAASRR